VLLEFFEGFVVEVLFVPVVLDKELVERAATVGWMYLACDTSTVLLPPATRPVT